MQNASVAISIIFGTLFSVIAGIVYIIRSMNRVRCLPRSPLWFFPLGGPLIAGTTGAARSPEPNTGLFSFQVCRIRQHSYCFFITYAGLPHLFDRTSVAACRSLQRLRHSLIPLPAAWPTKPPGHRNRRVDRQLNEQTGRGCPNRLHQSALPNVHGLCREHERQQDPSSQDFPDDTYRCDNRQRM